MTTARSPISALRKQADKMAAILKAAERGEPTGLSLPEKAAAARAKPAVKFAIAMDDKIIAIEMAWATIHTTSEAGISEYIVRQMREARDAVN